MDVDRRAHDYRLRYDDGTPEDVRGLTATAALASRRRAERPVQITDITAANGWLRSREVVSDAMPA